MKKCSRCLLTKSSSNFSYKNKGTGLLNPYCKECNRIYQKQHYILNKAYYSQKRAVNAEKATAANRRNIAHYLRAHPCIDCGEADPVVLEFDHVRGEKKSTIAEMLRNARKWSAIQEEIEKCEVRCSNCHKRRTARQFGWRKMIEAQSRFTR
jgi:hypothetical protein